MLNFLSFIDAPDHSLLCVGAHGKLHLLNIESAELAYGPLEASVPRHAAVGFLDGNDVLAALDAGGLRLYDLRTGELTTPKVEMSSTANGVAWGRVRDRDVVVTGHFATVRVWNPRTGRKITELRFGTGIGAISVRQTGGDRLLVAVSGPGLVLTELRRPLPECSACTHSAFRRRAIANGTGGAGFRPPWSEYRSTLRITFSAMTIRIAGTSCSYEAAANAIRQPSRAHVDGIPAGRVPLAYLESLRDVPPPIRRDHRHPLVPAGAQARVG